MDNDWITTVKKSIETWTQKQSEKAIEIRACEFRLANLNEDKLEIECALEMNRNRLKKAEGNK